MDDIKKRTIKVLSDVLNLSAEKLSDANEFTHIPGWDSLYQLNLVLGLEREFSVKFNIDEVMQISSVDSVVRLINQKI